MRDEIDDVAGRLDDIAERLADLSIELLQSALADTDSADERSRLERSVTRARRAAHKAATILRESAGAVDDDS